MESHMLLQLTDLHLVASGALRPGVDPLANLDIAVELITSSASRPEAIILTGDLVDGGDPASYALLRQRTDIIRAATGAQVVFMPGNHDDRRAFRECLLDTEPSDAPIDQVHWLGGLRVISLDTVIPGSDGGSLTSPQLDWLGSLLATPAPDGTILALHHPPADSPIVPMAAIGLADRDRLESVIEGSDICLVIAGHNHHAGSAMFGRIPLWMGPALAYTADTMTEERFVGRPGSAFSRIDVCERKTLVTVVPVVSK